MEMGMASKILEGLRDAVGFARGDKSKGSVTILHVLNGVNDEPLLDAAAAHALASKMERRIQRRVRWRSAETLSPSEASRSKDRDSKARLR
jgi:hypothetical protein